MDYKKQYEKEYADELIRFGRNKPNLMLVGGSGVGKSSLINRIFGSSVAETGVGKPVTDRIIRYATDTSFINIFDTMGYETKGEAGNANLFESEVLAELERRMAAPLSEQIHLVWYCISVTGHRIFDYDIDHLKRLKALSIPLFVVFTKCDEDSEDEEGRGVTATACRQSLADVGLGDLPCYETSIVPETPLSLDALLEASEKALDSIDMRRAFTCAQLRNLSLKKREAGKIIHTATAIATAAAAVPIPVSDEPVIAACQIGMAIKLARLYGFSVLDESVMALIKSRIAAMAGRQIAASLTKFVPVLGSVINATVAASLTEALGWGLVGAYSKLMTQYLETGREPVWADVFTSEFIEKTVEKAKEQARRKGPKE